MVSSQVTAVQLVHFSPVKAELYCVSFRHRVAGVAVKRQLLAVGQQRTAFALFRFARCVMQRMDGWGCFLSEAGASAPSLACLNTCLHRWLWVCDIFPIMRQRPAFEVVLFATFIWPKRSRWRFFAKAVCLRSVLTSFIFSTRLSALTSCTWRSTTADTTNALNALLWPEQLTKVQCAGISAIQLVCVIAAESRNRCAFRGLGLALS